jgi:uncharacterized hydrophobic protein (TIGR00271 family)
MSSASTALTGLFKSPETVYQEAYEGRQFDAVYFAMMIFACLIALMGLLLNSPAVIIGAMLISPLMGPILACGLALTTAEWALGKKAARNLGFSVTEVILISAIAIHLSPLRQATPEILARTNPNLMDLLIAFFSGLAGTVALTSRKTAFTILPGVAIATAVMPPLVTAGYGLGTAQWVIASGAFMLFFTNFTAIVLSASLVFLLIGFRPQVELLGEHHRMLIRWRIAIAASVLLLISVPLLRTLLRAAQQVNIRGRVEATLRQNMQSREDRQLESARVDLRRGAVVVDASIRTAQYIEPAEIEQLRSAIEKQISMPVHLRVQQLQLAQKAVSKEEVIRDFLAAGLVRPARESKPVPPAEQIGNLQQQIETSLGSLVGAAGVAIHVTAVGRESDRTVVNASARAPRFTSQDMWSVSAAGLANELSTPVKLNVEVAATDEALQIAYHGTSQQPSAGQLRRVRQFNSKVPPDSRVAFLCSADVEHGLAAKRIAHLRKAVLRDPAELRLDPPAVANAVLLVPVQTFTAESARAADAVDP